MRPADTAPNHSRRRRGFNLVEAAIVLGVVGLVIGGIWVTASALNSKRYVNEAASLVLFLARITKENFRFEHYPATLMTNLDITFVLASFRLPASINFNGLYILDNAGNRYRVLLSTWLNPSISEGGRGIVVQVYPPSGQTYPLRSESACIELITRFGSLLSNSSEYAYTQIERPGANLFFYPPYTLTNVSCPSDVALIDFWFRP
jgi:type II secretory pathway pseudopilin PulG